MTRALIVLLHDDATDDDAENLLDTIESELDDVVAQVEHFTTERAFKLIQSLQEGRG